MVRNPSTLDQSVIKTKNYSHSHVTLSSTLFVVVFLLGKSL